MTTAPAPGSDLSAKLAVPPDAATLVPTTEGPIMATFPIVDLSDDSYVDRIAALADAVGMSPDVYPGYLLDAAVRRLRDTWSDADDEPADDPTDSRWGQALDRLAECLGLASDNNPVHVIEDAAAALTATGHYGAVLRGRDTLDLPDGSVVIACDDAGTPLPLDAPNAAPWRVGEVNGGHPINLDGTYRVLLRAPHVERRHQPGDVIRGDELAALPKGSRYVEADDEGDPRVHAQIQQVRDERWVRQPVLTAGRYLVLSVPS